MFIIDTLRAKWRTESAYLAGGLILLGIFALGAGIFLMVNPFGWAIAGALLGITIGSMVVGGIAIFAALAITAAAFLWPQTHNAPPKKMAITPYEEKLAKLVDNSGEKGTLYLHRQHPQTARTWDQLSNLGHTAGTIVYQGGGMLTAWRIELMEEWDKSKNAGVFMHLNGESLDFYDFLCRSYFRGEGVTIYPEKKVRALKYSRLSHGMIFSIPRRYSFAQLEKAINLVFSSFKGRKSDKKLSKAVCDQMEFIKPRALFVNMLRDIVYEDGDLSQNIKSASDYLHQIQEDPSISQWELLFYLKKMQQLCSNMQNTQERAKLQQLIEETEKLVEMGLEKLKEKKEQREKWEKNQQKRLEEQEENVKSVLGKIREKKRSASSGCSNAPVENIPEAVKTLSVKTLSSQKVDAETLWRDTRVDVYADETEAKIQQYYVKEKQRLKDHCDGKFIAHNKNAHDLPVGFHNISRMFDYALDKKINPPLLVLNDSVHSKAHQSNCVRFLVEMAKAGGVKFSPQSHLYSILALFSPPVFVPDEPGDYVGGPNAILTRENLILQMMAHQFLRHKGVEEQVDELKKSIAQRLSKYQRAKAGLWHGTSQDALQKSKQLREEIDKILNDTNIQTYRDKLKRILQLLQDNRAEEKEKAEATKDHAFISMLNDMLDNFPMPMLDETADSVERPSIKI